MPVNALAYIELGVEDPDAWTRFAVEVLGLQRSAESTPERQLLRMDEKAWRIAVGRSMHNDILRAGFEVSGAEQALALRRTLEAAGCACRALSREERTARGVEDGFALEDPQGLVVEIVHGLRSAGEPFRSPLGVGFVTADQGLGHILLAAADLPAVVDFYLRLGFRRSDVINLPLGPDFVLPIEFLHCNRRHHTLAFAPLPGPRRLNHVMLEACSSDEVLQAYYRAQRASLSITRHLGRHTNDHMLSFYVATPAGFDVEYGCEGRHIDANWTPATYDSMSFWGHLNEP